MIEIQITPNQIERAKLLYPFDNLNGSITSGKSQIYGAIGEIVVMDHYNWLEVEYSGKYDYDIIIDGVKIDIKTKKTTVVPKPFYLCSVSDFNTRQKCDHYMFVRVMADYSKAWILGSRTKEAFYKISTFNRKGTLDTMNWRFKDDCYNLEISKLVPPKSKPKNKII